jgi:hypothetical protein
LKRQLQQQINRSLELRSVADVIVTDLEFQPTGASHSSADSDREQSGDAAAPVPMDAPVADESDWGETPAAS